MLHLRSHGKTREEISSQTSLSLGTVKKILLRNKAVLPMEVRQKNAYQAKLAKTPDAIQKMRGALTAEVVSRRSDAIRKRYAEDEALRLRKRHDARRFWDDPVASAKARETLSTRSGERAARFQSMLRLNGVSTVEQLMQKYADWNGGEFLGPYTGNKEPTSWKCGAGHVFSTIPNVVQRGHWCPTCATVGPSSGQLEILDYVRSLGVEVVSGDRTAISPMELDVYVPHLRLAIEYNGLYWHSSAVQERGRHFRKWRACYQNGVSLLAIYQDEWASLPTRELLKSMIRWRCRKFTGSPLNARDLLLREDVPRNEAIDFFNRNHLDGSTQFKSARGLYCDGRLVSCAAFRVNFNEEYELARLATDYDFSVRGAAGRLLARTHRPLVSFSNNRLSTGNVYRQLGFRLDRINRPSYWYTDGSTKVWRWACRRLNDPAILQQYPTEEAQALAGVFSPSLFGHSRALFRIEDYGHMKWVRDQSDS